MKKYDEIVKALNSCATGNCSDCPYQPHSNCESMMLHNAVEAIAALTSEDSVEKLVLRNLRSAINDGDMARIGFWTGYYDGAKAKEAVDYA